MLKRASESTRTPPAGRQGHGERRDRTPRAAADDGIALHSFFNFLFLGGPAPDIRALDQLLMRAPALPWRTAEDVEREVVHVALRHSGKRVEALELEDVLQACEVVEGRHLIDNATIARHFRNMWQASAAYCRAYMRGLFAFRPGDDAPAATARAPTTYRDGFSLARMVLPPYRILQGSYRYAGRSWCSRHWGTPVDARLLARRFESSDAGAVLGYEFETIDGAPVGALRRLMERYPRVALACVAVDNDNGLRLLALGGLTRPVEVTTLDPLPPGGGVFSGGGYLGCTEFAREQLHVLLRPTPGAAASAA